MTNHRAGRPMVFDHRHNPHTSIVMPDNRRDAIARVAQLLGVSSHVLIQRFITVGLGVFGEDS